MDLKNDIKDTKTHVLIIGDSIVDSTGLSYVASNFTKYLYDTEKYAVAYAVISGISITENQKIQSQLGCIKHVLQIYLLSQYLLLCYLIQISQISLIEIFGLEIILYLNKTFFQQIQQSQNLSASSTGF